MLPAARVGTTGPAGALLPCPQDFLIHASHSELRGARVGEETATRWPLATGDRSRDLACPAPETAIPWVPACGGQGVGLREAETSIHWTSLLPAGPEPPPNGWQRRQLALGVPAAFRVVESQAGPWPCEGQQSPCPCGVPRPEGPAH